MKHFLVLISCLLFISQTTFAQESTEIFSHRLGEYKISFLPESLGDAPKEILIGATPEMLERYAPYGSVPNSMSAFLVQSSGRNLLIDTGIGRKLVQNLKALGVHPEQVDVILLTHMHGDHIGGMLKDGKIVFPNAQVFIPKREYDYWMSDDEMNRVPENSRGGFMNARNVVQAYLNQINLFDPAEIDEGPDELIPGIKPVAAYGHTPGHTAFLIESGNSQFMVWGDLMHAMAIQMPYPDIAVTYDVNPELAIEYRKKIMAYLSRTRMPFGGMHLPFPGMAQLTESSAGGYVYKMF